MSERLGQQKVAFLMNGCDPGLESMWCDDLGSDRYRLDDIPVFKTYISIGDTLEAKPRFAGDARLYFDRLLKRSRNWTHHLLLTSKGRQEKTALDALLNDLIALTPNNHAIYQNHIVAVNVSEDQPESEVMAVERVMFQGEGAGIWEWEISSRPDLPLEGVEEYVAAHPEFQEYKGFKN